MIAKKAYKEARSLVGKSARDIHDAELQHGMHPHVKVILKAAKTIREKPSDMKEWTFADQWDDGTTLWRDPKGKQFASVSPDGSIEIDKI